MTYSIDRTAERSVLVVALTGKGRGRLVGLSVRSGEVLWRHNLGGGTGTVDLAIHGSLVFAAARTEGLFCLDYLTGRTHWAAPLSLTRDGRTTILVDEPYVFAGRGGEVECFDWQGNNLWHQDLPEMDVARLALGMPGNVRQADEVG